MIPDAIVIGLGSLIASFYLIHQQITGALKGDGDDNE